MSFGIMPDEAGDSFKPLVSILKYKLHIIGITLKTWNLQRNDASHFQIHQ